MTWTTRPRSEYPGEITGIRSGAGVPVVLIHGVGLTADSWGAQIEDLAQTYQVHALDLPGHGGSPALAGGIRLHDLTDVLARAIGSIDWPVHLVGHSVGALVALDMAVRYPDLVGSVAALNAIHRRSEQARDAVRARAASMSASTNNDPVPTLTRWFGDALDSEPAIACRRWLEAVEPAAYKATYAAFAEADSPADEQLAAIGCPALFLTGTDEPNSTPEMSQSMASLVPGRAVIVPGAAHMAMMTHAAIVNAELISLFGEQS